MQEERLIDTLRKVLALTHSPNEGEAAAAAERLQFLLTKHNLSVADLEQRGASKPNVKEEGHDLGKAAFNWKLDLAEVMAEHYYCWAIVSRYSKTVTFIGRPDNIESLKMLYAWVIDQIKRISSEERKVWMAANDEHVDPLRWQVNFGLGVVSRIGARLKQLRESQTSDVTALVLSHKSEISDFMEQRYGRRIDGKKTQRETQFEQEMAEKAAIKEALKRTDIEAFYNAYPWERPLTPEQQVQKEKEEIAFWKRQERNAARRTGRTRTARIDWHKEEQALCANQAGRNAANKVNLQPFVKGEKEKEKLA